MTIFNLDFTDKKTWLKITDFENILNIYKDKSGKYFYNLNNGLYINIDDKYLQTFVCTTDMHWPLISYHIYNTTRLAWLLLKLNKVDAKHVFDIKEAGSTIKYLSKQNIQTLIEDINTVE